MITKGKVMNKNPKINSFFERTLIENQDTKGKLMEKLFRIFLITNNYYQREIK